MNNYIIPTLGENYTIRTTLLWEKISSKTAPFEKSHNCEERKAGVDDGCY